MRRLATALRTQLESSKKMREALGQASELIKTLTAVVEKYQQQKVIELKEPSSRTSFAA